MDYKFTAKMENNLDKISLGKIDWIELLKSFYIPFNTKYESLKKDNIIKNNDDRYLGEYKDGDIYATTTKFGQALKIDDGSTKCKYVSIQQPHNAESITLKEALTLLQYPKNIGDYNSKKIELCKGRYGYYLKYNGKNYNANYDINLDDAINIIIKKNKNNIKEIKIKNKIYEIKNGNYGPYISYSKNNKKVFTSIPKNINPENITNDDIIKLINKPKKIYKSFH